MKKIILALSLILTTSAFSADIKIAEIFKNVTCIEGITYFVGFTYADSFRKQYFVSSVKIDNKTLLPERCDF